MSAADSPFASRALILVIDVSVAELGSGLRRPH
jgi:hypothetical protein